MINICVKGGLKKDRKLADEAIWYVMDMMMPRHRKIDISLTFKKTLEDGAQGFCYRGDNDYEYIIEIDHRLSRLISAEEFIECIMHEMVHVKQQARDEFQPALQKMEDEAYEKQEILLERWKDDK